MLDLSMMFCLAFLAQRRRLNHEKHEKHEREKTERIKTGE
jgi:hypothetical protein